MNLRLLAVLGFGTGIFAGSFGCSSAHTDAAASGGSAGSSETNVAGTSNPSSGGDSGGGASGGAGATVGPGTTESACIEHPTPLRTRGTVLSLSLQPLLAGKPFEFGQPNMLADGGTLVPLNFRFYVSQVELLQSSGAKVSVDLVDAAGVSEPYGVHLFNAEEGDTSTLRVLAPPGDYTALSFALGIKLGCNQQPPAKSSEPLTDVSQMTWPHTGGFLFLRYEGRYTAKDGSTDTRADIPPAVHMGGDITKELVPRLIVSNAFSIPATGTLEMGLGLTMDKLFEGATANIDVSDVAVGILSTPESIAGERLRRELPTLSAFVLDPLPK